MKMFSKDSTTEYAILLDIGSGSVSLSVIDIQNREPKIVWFKNDRLLLKNLDGINHSVKQIMSTVANLLMQFYTEGVKELNISDKKSIFTTMQVSVAAPFAHTISKKILYQKNKAFIFNDALLENLVETAQEKIIQSEQDVAKEVALEPTSRIIMQEYINGYSVDLPKKQEVKKLELAITTTFLHTYIDKELKEIHEKLLPEAQIRNYSFILMLYYVLEDLYPEMQEYCLINQTLEATELAVIRDGVLTFTTHDGYGIASLVREISEVINSPLEEVFSSIKSDVFSTQYKKLSDKKQKTIDSILTNYEKRIMDLLQQTGDGYTIPKSIYLHTTSCTYDFFAKRIERGAEKTTGFGHIVHNLDADSLGYGQHQEGKNKSCIELVSRYFFHNCAESIRYKQI